jgi:hypothetical protein
LLANAGRRTFRAMAGMMGAAPDLGIGMGSDGGDALTAQMSDEEKERRKKLLQQGGLDGGKNGVNALSPAVASLFGGLGG